MSLKYLICQYSEDFKLKHLVTVLYLSQQPELETWVTSKGKWYTEAPGTTKIEDKTAILKSSKPWLGRRTLTPGVGGEALVLFQKKNHKRPRAEGEWAQPVSVQHVELWVSRTQAARGRSQDKDKMRSQAMAIEQSHAQEDASSEQKESVNTSQLLPVGEEEGKKEC